MDSVNKRLLTAEERAIYGAWQEMFSTPGWRLFVARCQDEADEAQRLYDKVGNDVGFARLQGHRHALITHVLTVQNTIEVEVEQLVKAREAALSESLEDDVEE